MPIPLGVTRFNKRYLNRVMRHLVGHGPFVELEHVGRRTGTARRVPLCGFLDEDRTTVTCALTYGPRVDWYRNVVAAGGGRMRVGEHILTLGPPRTLDPAVGLARMPAPARVILRAAGVTDVVELPILASGPR